MKDILKRARKRMGKTERGMANMLGIRVERIREYEAADERVADYPSDVILRRVADVYRLTDLEFIKLCENKGRALAEYERRVRNVE